MNCTLSLVLPISVTVLIVDQHNFNCVQVDGQAALLEATQQFLFVLTDAGRLCMWSLAGQEAKPYGATGRAVDLPPDLTVLSMRCNCDGTKVKAHLLACATLGSLALLLLSIDKEPCQVKSTIMLTGLIHHCILRGGMHALLQGEWDCMHTPPSVTMS